MLMQAHSLTQLSDHDLGTLAALCRNRRDAYAQGREPSEVRVNLARVLSEQQRRRDARREAAVT